jgi:hypothetical protein
MFLQVIVLCIIIVLPHSFLFAVPYRTCLKLVAERKVDLVNGEAHIPCGVWKNLLVAVFNLHLQYGYHEMVLSGCQSYALQDARMLQLTNFMEFKFKVTSVKMNKKN